MSDMDAHREAVAEQPAHSFGQRFVGVFMSPDATFREVVRRPDYILPLLLIMLVSAGVSEAILTRIGMTRIIRLSLEQSGRAARMTPDQLERAIRQGASVAGILAHVGGILGPPILLLAIAGFGLLVINGFLGEGASFRTVFSITCYANFPQVLAGLIALPIILFGDPQGFNIQAPVPSNVAFFLNPQTVSRPVYVLASSFDLFTIWTLVLLALGMSRLRQGKAGTRLVFLIYFGAWMAIVMAKVGLSLIS